MATERSWRRRRDPSWLRLAVLFLATVLSGVFGPAPSAAEDLLEALKRCPSNGPTCLRMRANLNWPDERSRRVSDHPAVIEVVGQDQNVDVGIYFGHIIVRIVGRLDGGEPQPYRLRIGYPDNMHGCNDFTVAAVAARPQGGGVILTRQGVLEIVSTDIVIGSRHSVALIDGDAVTFGLSPDWSKVSWGADLVATEAGHIFWRTSDVCLDLEAEGGFRRVGEAECVGKEIAPASPDEVSRVRDAGVFTNTYVTSRLGHDLWRLEGTPLLLYIGGVACT